MQSYFLAIESNPSNEVLQALLGKVKFLFNILDLKSNLLVKKKPNVYANVFKLV